MAYDFTSVVERRGTACVKWDAPNGAGIPAGEVIPMWVADMDFRTAPCIIDALRKRVEHGVFGYTEVPESYYDAVIVSKITGECLRDMGFKGEIYIPSKLYKKNGLTVGCKKLSRWN